MKAALDSRTKMRLLHLRVGQREVFQMVEAAKRRSEEARKGLDEQNLNL